MIKINLLGVAPPPTKVISAGGPPAPKATQIFMFVAAMVICFGVVGVIYKVWTNQIADLEKKKIQEKIRQTELAAVKAQNERYQQHLSDLETRINTIQALQNSRVGPVELMSALGSIVSKTNDIYLYTMNPAGDRVQLKGQSNTVDSMANLLAFLKNSGSFQDVQLEQFYQDDQHDRLTYKFQVSCQFKSPTGGISPTAGSAPEGPGAPAGTGGPAVAPGAPSAPQGVATQLKGPQRSL
ncbi:MAG: PilN domain-containing protein [Acidobacteriota bacterium]|nr:PilN domain-containing protein [Acidobacteriota bacterium]